jgi:two-component system capsular synthesis response regulator RcsB
MKVVFSAETITALMTYLKKIPVDILVCDYKFEDDLQKDGLDLLRKLQQCASGMHIILLSGKLAPYVVSSALKIGTAGFVGKGKSDFVDLPQVIRTVYAGNIFLSPSLSTSMHEQMYGRDKKLIAIERLSHREFNVVSMICCGMSINEIATRLKRSPKTISNQKISAMKKLGVSNDVALSLVFDELTN